MKTIYIVTEGVCEAGGVANSLMAFDCLEDAEKMAKVNNWAVKELLLVESNKAKINLRETPTATKEEEPQRRWGYPFYEYAQKEANLE